MKLKALIAEFVGTFCLLFALVGAAVSCQLTPVTGERAGTVTLLIVALAQGLAIAVCGSALGHVSGGHFNPAVSLGMALTKKMGFVSMIGYWIAQFAGAIAGTYAVSFAMPEDAFSSSNAAAPALYILAQPTQGLFLEAVGTFFLTLVVFGTAVDRRASKVGAWFIGLTLTTMVLAFGPVTGGSMNPARWLGPSLINGAIEEPLVFFVGPLIGGALAALLYSQVLAKGEMDEAPA
ncbi:MAG: aquaporin [Methanoregulaceae archaeon]|nr:aquaporin [Methanoregulaceae archaeon]